ncbi:MAG: oxygen-independent coproporphyrinogen III oxidase [Gammaproteobacteria bacterium]|jgi:oxygen-independent coproporphyrinogen-3 oxidase
MDLSLTFNAELIRRYDKAGPRYTSYPTAVQFHDGFGEKQYRKWAQYSNQHPPGQPLSLYFHLPFCATVCYYCACNKIITKNRARAIPYLEHLHREIAMQGELFDKERKVEQLHWGGGTPTFINHAQMRELMRVTGEHFNLRDDDQGEYSIEVDPREADADTIRLLREIGFNRLSMGVQDFDPAVQQAVNRNQSEEETVAVLEAARQQGFKSVSMDLIYGLPHQSVASFARTLDKVIAAAPDRLSVFNYAHLPAMFKTQRQMNEADMPAPAVKLGILQHTIEQLGDAGYVYIGMDHFARPDDELALAQHSRTLYRNFQGYSTHADCDLVAMGSTSISKVGQSYSQNVKDLEGYYSRIDNAGLPVFRGVELDADDLLRREVITQLMCHFTLDIPALETDHAIKFSQYFDVEQVELQKMQDDGLLLHDDSQVTVLPAGRLLVRNICMVFDRYLRNTQGTRQFSRVI